MRYEDMKADIELKLKGANLNDVPGQTRNCLTCLHCDITGPECRRHPPKPVDAFDQRGDPVDLLEFPRTELDLWCGEWKRNPRWKDDAKVRLAEIDLALKTVKK